MHTIDVGGYTAKVRDLLSSAMKVSRIAFTLFFPLKTSAHDQPVIASVQSKGLCGGNNDPVRFHMLRAQQAIQGCDDYPTRAMLHRLV